MENYNWVDYIILGVFFFSILAGLMRGIVKEVLSILTWVAAFIIASLFAGRLAELFTHSNSGQSIISGASSAAGVNAEQSISIVSLGLSFVCLFLVTLIIGSLFTNVISRAVDSAGIGIANRLFGAIFGIFRGFLINLLIVFVVQLTSLDQAESWKQSKLVPMFQPSAAWVGNLVHPGLESLKSKVGQTLQGATQSVIGSIYQFRG